VLRAGSLGAPGSTNQEQPLSRRPVHLFTRADRGAAVLLIALVLAWSALIAASASADPGPGTAGARAERGPGAGPIYFWANLGFPVKTPVHGFHNPPVIRPATFIIFEDGSWEIEKLHWTGWGSPVAKATGKSNADTDVPNVAEGKRIITPAKVILFDPGSFGGRRVYRCIRIKLQKPAKFPTSCLRRTGNSVGLNPPGIGTPVGDEAEEGVRHVAEFFSPGRQVWCQISTLLAQASCGTSPEPPTHSALMTKTGKVEICAVERLEYPGGAGHGPPAGCYQNWPTERLPILRIGEATGVGGFRCSSAADGITCVKVAGQGKGSGFRIDAEEAMELPASARRADSSAGASEMLGRDQATPELATRRPACTRRALTKGLRSGGLRGYIDGETFGCAGRFAYAGVIVDRNEVTVLFRATGRHWQPASRARYCENGAVPKQIYQPACESN